MIKNFFGGKLFWQNVFRLGLPIAIQNLLISSFSLIDTIMVGQLGDVSLSAVGMAGQWTWLLNLVLFGFYSGSSVFISQYWGVKDIKKIHNIYGILFIHAVILSIGFTAVGFFAPSFVVHLFTNTPDVVNEGVAYLRIAVFSYLAIALNGAFSTLLRSTENVKLPMYTSCISTAANALLNYILIFGKLGFPAMGVAGAAVATCISAWISPVLLLCAAFRQKNIMYANIKNIFNFPKQMVFNFYKISSPVIFNETTWGLGTFIYNMVFGHMSYKNYAALTIYRTVEGIAFVFFVGLCNACSVILGKLIGAGEIEEGKRTAKRFSLISPVLGIIIGFAMILLQNQIIFIFNVNGGLSESTVNTVKGLIWIAGTEYFMRLVPYIQIVGIFRPGGDTLTGMILDLIFLWGFALPVTFISAVVLKLPFLAVMAIMLYCEDTLKSILCIRHMLSNKWIKPITEQGKKAMK